VEIRILFTLAVTWVRPLFLHWWKGGHVDDVRGCCRSN